MKELLLVCAVAAIIVFGYFIMKELDTFLANNRRLIDAEIAENSIFCEKTGCTIEPLNPSDIQTAVIWKKASNNAFVNSFSDLLLSNQAAINAEYVK